MKKIDLIQKLKQLDGISQDERAYIINLVNTKKKYGMVWEDKPEDVEELLRENLPVLKEVKEKRILGAANANEHRKTNLFSNQDNQLNPINHGSDNFPNHILIEGDNLHALTALTFTHENKIDVIYIDPPYNTGNKDFKYNDSFVDKEDSYRHSKWLSFMNKRLHIAKRLLNEKGVIFISIDDNEIFQLKMLCDEIFQNGFISALPRITKSSGKTTNKIALNHDYILVFAKNKELSVIEGLEHNDAGFKYADDHLGKRGLYKLNQTLDYDSLQYSASLDYEIIIDGEKLYPGSDYEKHLERKNGKYSRADWAWRWSKHLYEFGLANDFIVLKKSRNGSRIYTKTYLNAKIEKDDMGNYYIEYYDRKKPLTSLDFTDSIFSNDNAKKDLDNVLRQSIFDYPKPLSILNTFLKTNPNKIVTILDFFAGSGTSLHSTMQLNAEDGGSRQCILVTNNENNICEEVTYERNKRVIQGYTNAKGEQVPGLINNNLRYFKSEFVSREPSVKNKKEITKLATELLCIKEGIYAEQKTIGEYQLNATYVKCFKQNKLYLMILYDEDVIEQMVEVVQTVIAADKERKAHFKVYVFSNGQYPYTEEFEEVLPFITLCALPDAIYKAYQNVLPKRQRKAIPELEEQTAEEVETQLDNDTIDLFNQR